MTIRIQKSTGQALARKVRLSDKQSDAIMKDCLRQSPIVWESSIDGEGACIWGLIPASLLSGRAYIWLYTTEVADQHTFILVRQSRLMIEEMLKEGESLYGFCKIEDPRAIRWLKWLGAEFGEPDGRKIPFQIRKK